MIPNIDFFLTILILPILIMVLAIYLSDKLHSKDNLKKFINNPITAAISSIFLIQKISESDIILYILKSDPVLIIMIYIIIILTTTYIIVNFYLKKIKNDFTLENPKILSQVNNGVKLIILIDFIYFILSIKDKLF